MRNERVEENILLWRDIQGIVYTLRLESFSVINIEFVLDVNTNCMTAYYAELQ